MNALYLKDLADKTRRGLRGRVEVGKFAGGLCYGYTPVLNATGERELVPAEATIVQRIFRSYASGLSPKGIAKQLNAERVPGPMSNGKSRNWSSYSRTVSRPRSSRQI